MSEPREEMVLVRRADLDQLEAELAELRAAVPSDRWRRRWDLYLERQRAREREEDA